MGGEHQREGMTMRKTVDTSLLTDAEKREYLRMRGPTEWGSPVETLPPEVQRQLRTRFIGACLIVAAALAIAIAAGAWDTMDGQAVIGFAGFTALLILPGAYFLRAYVLAERQVSEYLAEIGYSDRRATPKPANNPDRSRSEPPPDRRAGDRYSHQDRQIMDGLGMDEEAYRNWRAGD